MNKPIGLKNLSFEDYAFYGLELIKSGNVTDVDISISVHKNLESSTVSKIELTKMGFKSVIIKWRSPWCFKYCWTILTLGYTRTILGLGVDYTKTIHRLYSYTINYSL